MNTNEISKKYNINKKDFEKFLASTNRIKSKGWINVNVDDADVEEAVKLFVQDHTGVTLKEPEMSHGDVFVFIAVIIWIGGLIMGIILGMNQGTFKFLTALMYWAGAFVSGLFFMGLKGIVSNQEMIMAELKKR